MLTDKQHEARRTGIGASESAIVMNIVSYSSPYELWMRKTGRLEKDESLHKERMMWGNLLEDAVAKGYEQMTGEKLYRVIRTLRHKEHPFILCHLDRRIKSMKKIVEIKTSNPFYEEWGEAGTDEIPLAYTIQVQHQLAVTGWSEADLIMFKNTNDCRIYSIKRDEEIIKLIVEKLKEFWNNYVLADTAPPLRDKADACLAYPLNLGNLIEANEDILKIISNVEIIKKQIKLLEQEKNALQDKIFLFIKENDGIKAEDKTICTWKANKNGVRTLRNHLN